MINVMKPIKVLLVEDNPGDARLLAETLTEVGWPQFDLTHVEEMDEARRRLSRQKFDVVLLDLALPDSLRLETLTKIHDQAPKVPVVVITGLDDDVFALFAVQEGAQDYLVKGQLDATSLARSILFAMERHDKLARNA